jgi:hypothetical protein
MSRTLAVITITSLKCFDAKEVSHMTTKLDASTARALIERSLEAFGGKSLPVKAKPVIEAALEAARQSSRAAGKRSLSLTGVSVHSCDDILFQVVASGPRRSRVNAKKDRTPIAYGGPHETCYLVYNSTPPVYVCLHF